MECQWNILKRIFINAFAVTFKIVKQSLFITKMKIFIHMIMTFTILHLNFSQILFISEIFRIYNIYHSKIFNSISHILKIYLIKNFQIISIRFLNLRNLLIWLTVLNLKIFKISLSINHWLIFQLSNYTI